MKSILASVRAYYATNEMKIITTIQAIGFIILMCVIIPFKDLQQARIQRLYDRIIEKNYTIIEHKGDHELILSNGKSILVESVYNQAFEIGQVFIIK